jgi:antitoxin component YwqK of YwqJK toxin-antitoxin module
MKHTLLIITALMLVVGCSSDKEPIDGNTLITSTGGLMYAPGSDKPYSGEAVWYYDDGQKSDEVTYKDGKINGLWTCWDKDGQKMTETTFKDGKQDGLKTFWLPYVKDSSELIYKDGQPWDGLRTEWYDSGQKMTETTFKDGKEISKKCWDEDGDECECDRFGDCK